MAKFTVFYVGKSKIVEGIVKARATAYQMMLEGNYKHNSAYIVPGEHKTIDYRWKGIITVQPQGMYARPRDAIKNGHTFSLIKDGHAMYPFQKKNLDGTIERRR